MIDNSAGYSGTPLYKKLGIKQGFYIKLINCPSNYLDLLPGLPNNVVFAEAWADGKFDLIHFFTKQVDEYYKLLPLLLPQIMSNGVIRASWPKKSSKVATDITEDIIRNYAIEIGLVDIKVCAIDQTWSGLKLVIPIKNRT